MKNIEKESEKRREVGVWKRSGSGEGQEEKGESDEKRGEQRYGRKIERKRGTEREDGERRKI